ncbi:MAG TPA: hypothetical protein VGR96_02700 [Acidobacteriaceae bacterium]|nr:hypothetical protein [Acidobacteriaceae bacterium]
MSMVGQQFCMAILVLAAAAGAAGQGASIAPVELQDSMQFSPLSAPVADTPAAGEMQVAPTFEPLLEFKDSDVKFALTDLMDILRDNEHEGWVLLAYPDPKTHRPLIGAGFSLDLPEREHLQRDPLNPHPFLEPSSAELWQAAGLDPERLQTILDEFGQRFRAAGSYRRYRARMRKLAPQITEEEGARLLRIAVIQAVYNAEAYCRDFDKLTASQQMALSQLVYQMGVNLDEFSEFLTLINSGVGAGVVSGSGVGTSVAPRIDSGIGERTRPISGLGGNDAGRVSAVGDSAVPAAVGGDDSDHWRDVQRSLMQSQWARLYRARAVSVIAMLDPRYPDDPATAERRVAATLRPAVARRYRRPRAKGSVAVSSGGRRAAVGHKMRRARSKRRA